MENLNSDTVRSHAGSVDDHAQIVVDGLSKSYKKVRAIENISFSVAKGELFGLIGPDGAGKSTIFRILTTLLLPDRGSALVGGYDIIQQYKSIRNIVGYMPGKFSLYQDLSVEENLNFFAAIFNTSVSENYKLIQEIYTQIEPFRKRPAGKLSGGMKQKLALCCALIHKPGILFLDEPTTGVDTVSRKEFWNMLKRIRAEGITIIVSTPYMDEAILCDRIALIQQGKLMSVDTPNGIIEKFPVPLFATKADNMSRLLTDLRRNAHIRSCNAFGEYHHITLRQVTAGSLQDMSKALNEAGHTSLSIQPIRPTIEDCFIELMQ